MYRYFVIIGQRKDLLVQDIKKLTCEDLKLGESIICKRCKHHYNQTFLSENKERNFFFFMKMLNSRKGNLINNFVNETKGR